MINICEIFSSIQGEGQRTGRNSIFVRTGLCNFNCPGFGVAYEDPKTGEIQYGCDSFYSVNPGFKKDWKQYIDYKELVDDILAVIPDYGVYNLLRPDIVFTGGEPLVYWEDETYQRTLAYFVSRGHKVTIETNAAMDIEFTREYQKQIQFSQSVKLSCSGEPQHKRINPSTLIKIAENSPSSYLKFVVSKSTWNQDYEEIKIILDTIPVYVDVWLMPLGDTVETMAMNQKFTAEKCIERGFSYSHRVHISVWNNLAGV
jgi:organic radical activating enzyme